MTNSEMKILSKMQHDCSITVSNWTKRRRVRSNDSILSYSTFFRAYELHTKVIYLRNSFRFDFKWRELTADLPGYAYHRVERERQRETRSPRTFIDFPEAWKNARI